MSNILELEIDVERGASSKRRDLCEAIDFALSASGLRIRAGTYRVTVQRVRSEKGALATKRNEPYGR